MTKTYEDVLAKIAEGHSIVMIGELMVYNKYTTYWFSDGSIIEVENKYYKPIIRQTIIEDIEGYLG